VKKTNVLNHTVMEKNILIIGGGGREHSLAWKLKQSPKVSKIFIAPGNAGTAQEGENVGIKVNEFDKLIEFVKKENIDLTVVGPDDPLALGIVDAFQSQGLKIWGPNKKAAQIEASKAFAKELMRANNIPTAEYKVFTDYDEALAYTEKKGVPTRLDSASSSIEPRRIVIKASGLALGKGVAVCQNPEEAKKFLRQVMVEKIFGDSGSEVVIEEFLEGQEFSIHAFCDGKNFTLLPASQDHKAIFDGGIGPNTGGMGTIAPLPWVDQELMNEVASRIVKPVLDGLKNMGAPFTGLLYPGLMMTKTGPKVIEFNSRFGDPETQSYMRLLKTDLFDILDACVNGNLNKLNIEWHPGFACCIALASGGYPGKYEKGKTITGIEEAEKMDGIIVFHAGTIILDSMIATNGGRVLGVTATGDTLKEALDKAYEAIKLINFEGMHYRKDIGAKSLTFNNNHNNNNNQS